MKISKIRFWEVTSHVPKVILPTAQSAALALFGTSLQISAVADCVSVHDHRDTCTTLFRLPWQIAASTLLDPPWFRA